MAKEFKDYDKHYSELKHTTLFWERYTVEFVEHAGKTVTKWTGKPPSSWSPSEIRNSVYGEDSDHPDLDVLIWQQFRVSLKGFSTGAKLFRLKNYQKRFTAGGVDCRVDNYLGALKRGGYLNDKYEILK